MLSCATSSPISRPSMVNLTEMFGSSLLAAISRNVAAYDSTSGLTRGEDVLAQPVQRRRQALPGQPGGDRQRIVEPVAGDKASNQRTGPSAVADESLDLIALGRGQDSAAQHRRHHPRSSLHRGGCRSRSVTVAIATSATTPSTAKGAATPAASASTPTAAGPATSPMSLERRTAPTARPPPPPR